MIIIIIMFWLRFIFYSPKSQITNLSKRALQSVHIRHPWPLWPHIGSGKTPKKRWCMLVTEPSCIKTWMFVSIIKMCWFPIVAYQKVIYFILLSDGIRSSLTQMRAKLESHSKIIIVPLHTRTKAILKLLWHWINGFLFERLVGTARSEPQQQKQPRSGALISVWATSLQWRAVRASKAFSAGLNIIRIYIFF